MIEMAAVYKVAGFCFLTATVDKVLRICKKNDLADLVHILSYGSISLYCIKFVLDHCKILKIGW
jgi:hypothetical protein